MFGIATQLLNGHEPTYTTPSISKILLTGKICHIKEKAQHGSKDISELRGSSRVIRYSKLRTPRGLRRDAKAAPGNPIGSRTLYLYTQEDFMNSKRLLMVIVAVGVLALLMAAGGMLHSGSKMNSTADSHPGMSAGRSGDPAPNAIQEQQDKASAHGPATTGTTPSTSSVPPASR